MDFLFSAPTFLLCLVVGWVLVAILLTASWSFEKRAEDLGYWSAGFWLISIGCLFQSLSSFLAEGVGAGFGIGFVSAGISLLWIGFRTFDGFSKPYLIAAIFPLVWFVLYFGFLDFFVQPNHRIAFYSILVTTQIVPIIVSIWRGWQRERLPARLLIVVMLVMYSVITISRVPVTFLYPVKEVDGITSTLWFGVVSFVLYVNGLGVALGIFSLSSERSLRQYKHASETDSLTGALNRRAFNERVNTALTCRRGLIALIDIDHFKAVNDQYGHAGGDAVLCRFTEIVTTLIADDMVFGRTGGEEFTLFVPNATGEDALAICEQIRQRVAQTPIFWRDHRINLSVSIGLCEMLRPEGDIDVALMRADAALYAAKDRGRNRVVVWAPPDSHEVIPQQTAVG